MGGQQIESKTTSAETILKRMHLEGNRIYMLGCGEKRVTIYSQQCRALNLIWALHSTRRNEIGGVGIIGGGVAGMTAAMAAASLGYNTTVLEWHPMPFYTQQNCPTRFIHPREYDWPFLDKIPEPHKAKLPILDWEAGPAASVADKMRRQWQKFPYRHLVNFEGGRRARRTVITNEGDVAVTVEGDGMPERRFSFVIVAVGFGLEKTPDGDHRHFPKYWDFDELRAIGNGPSRHWLVTGCGDGGLIDVQRLRLLNFEQGGLLSQGVLDHPDMEGCKKQLREIELEARKLRETHDDRKISEFLETAYEGVGIPPVLADWIIGQLRFRDDTIVTLNGQYPHPYNIRSSVLNRFMLLAIRRYQPGGQVLRLNYFPRDLNLRNIYQQDGKFRVRNWPTEYEAGFDGIVVRHGAQLPGDGLKLEIPECDYDDPTCVPAWPKDFFPVPAKQTWWSAPALQIGIGLLLVISTVMTTVLYRNSHSRMAPAEIDAALDKAWKSSPNDGLALMKSVLPRIPADDVNDRDKVKISMGNLYFNHPDVWSDCLDNAETVYHGIIDEKDAHPGFAAQAVLGLGNVFNARAYDAQQHGKDAEAISLYKRAVEYYDQALALHRQIPGSEPAISDITSRRNSAASQLIPTTNTSNP